MKKLLKYIKILIKCILGLVDLLIFVLLGASCGKTIFERAEWVVDEEVWFMASRSTYLIYWCGAFVVLLFFLVWSFKMRKSHPHRFTVALLSPIIFIVAHLVQQMFFYPNTKG